MQAVMVVILPEIPDDAEGDPVAVQMQAIAKALNVPEMKGGRMIATIEETAMAVMQVVEPDGLQKLM